MPFFTVVIPLYNKENFVAETLRSVLGQTFGDFELVVVDDASTDRSIERVKFFDDPRISILYHDRNKGLSAARNTGVLAANSPIIAFLDADDLWFPQFLEKIARLIRDFPQAGLYATNYVERYSKKNVPIRHRVAIPEGGTGIVSDYFAAASAQPILWYGCTAVRKEVFAIAGYFDESVTLSEDVDFNIRANLCFPLAYCNEACAVYQVVSENQIMQSSIVGKTIPDLGKYEKEYGKHKNLKRYLDVNRYMFAMQYKLESQKSDFRRIANEIDTKNLSFSQRLLLAMPARWAKLLRRVKLWMVNKGVRVTTFGR